MTSNEGQLDFYMKNLPLVINYVLGISDRKGQKGEPIQLDFVFCGHASHGSPLVPFCGTFVFEGILSMIHLTSLQIPSDVQYGGSGEEL